MNRYQTMFAELAARPWTDGQGASRPEAAFVPFALLGYPSAEASLELMRCYAENGADALELGIPFSDPVADGPVLQAASQQALDAGMTPSAALEIVGRFREEYPAMPLGLLVYANLLAGPGIERFYGRVAELGVDSVLVADVPSLEAEPFVKAARNAGVAPVLIVTPNARPEQVVAIAGWSEGYTYVVSRSGVTGAETRAGAGHDALYARLAALNAAPPVLGFGISSPEQVSQAVREGALGVISASAILKRLAAGAELSEIGRMVRAFKAATRPA